MQGFEAVMTNGADERGLTIQLSAEKAGRTPDAFVARRLINVDTLECDDCRKLAEAEGGVKEISWLRLSSALPRFPAPTRLRTLAIGIR